MLDEVSDQTSPATTAKRHAQQRDQWATRHKGPLLGGLADVERDLIRTRTAEGRERARADGVMNSREGAEIAAPPVRRAGLARLIIPTANNRAGAPPDRQTLLSCSTSSDGRIDLNQPRPDAL
jgi:hypothetical protein